MSFNYTIFYKNYPYFDFKDYQKFNSDLLHSSLKTIDLFKHYQDIGHKNNLLSSVKHFYILYPSFNIEIYIEFNIDKKKYLELNDNTSILKKWHNEKNKDEKIYSIESYKKILNIEDNIFKLEELSPLELKNFFYEKYPNFNFSIFKFINTDLLFESEIDYIIYWCNQGRYEDRTCSIKNFYERYLNKLNFDLNVYINIYHDESEFWNIKNEHNILIHFYKRYLSKKEKLIYFNKDSLSVNNIDDALLDIKSLLKTKLERGVSLIIRAKNEEENIKDCIESVIDLVDEIIFVDNNSTDNTFKIVEEYQKIHKHLKIYKYNLSFEKVGDKHKQALKENNKNTVTTYYNWCLSKATKYTVIKWDADFICIRNNFKEMVNIYNLRTREDKFALWFTGKTLFEYENNYYLNHSSFYNEFRVFSYKNGFKWHDAEICEYVDPYVDTCQNKYKYIYPVFYELKRKSIDEFSERSSLIDNRDIKDFQILTSLNFKENNNLIKISNPLINNNIKIIIYTPSLELGGGNQFIIEMYKVYKLFGFGIKIISAKVNQETGFDKYTDILKSDILPITFIENYQPDFIFFNSSIDINQINISKLSKITKLIFITHSDVAYSNIYIRDYHQYFYKIITVNNYTIEKIIRLCNIQKEKLFKLINYTDIQQKTDYYQSFLKIKNKTCCFGIISRFSIDKNIPMFIDATVEVFKLYPNYKCYLVGSSDKKNDDFLKYLIKFYKLENNIIFVGYEKDPLKYYKLFDFVILPSVSEGASYNIIESISLGIPVIASNVGGNHELIEHNKTGILFELDGIRKFEKDTLYIENYQKQLEIIGYIFDNNTEFYYRSNKEVWNKNKKNIVNAILKMVNLSEEERISILNNQIKFICDNFNKKIYFNQLLKMINF
jgi:glycosyltransferase involved in cell wall biosynthesis